MSRRNGIEHIRHCVFLGHHCRHGTAVVNAVTFRDIGSCFQTNVRVRESHMSLRAIRVLGVVAAVSLGACDSPAPRSEGSLQSDHSTSSGHSAASSIATVAGVSGECKTRDARRQRLPTMPAPQRATRPSHLGPGAGSVGGHSADLLPVPLGAVAKVRASAAWATAHLPSAGGGTAAIVLGTYPGEVPGSPDPVTAWLVYAAGVAITNGYPWHPAPPVYGIRGPCAFGYLEVFVDATTGKVLQEGYDMGP